MSSYTLITVVVLALCHWLADFTQLSTPWMLKAKQFGSPLFPIFVHAGVHAMLFFLACAILYEINSGIIALAIQWPTHFLIDVWKGRMNSWFPALQNSSSPYHWWIFGFDQFLHQLVILLIVYVISR